MNNSVGRIRHYNTCCDRTSLVKADRYFLEPGATQPNNVGYNRVRSIWNLVSNCDNIILLLPAPERPLSV